MSETTTDLAPVVLPSGEAIALRDAEPGELAEFHQRALDQKATIAAVEGAIEDEMIRRLDRRGKWTVRARPAGADHEFEISAPSPTAGTTHYDPAQLEDVLRELIDGDVIDAEAAAAALKRRVSVEFAVPLEGNPAAIADAFTGVGITVGGVPLQVVKADGSRTAVAAGIAALEKIGDVAKEAVARARFTTGAGRRKPKVKRIEKKA